MNRYSGVEVPIILPGPMLFLLFRGNFLGKGNDCRTLVEPVCFSLARCGMVSKESGNQIAGAIFLEVLWKWG